MISEVFFDLGKLSFNVGKVIRLSSFLECGGAITKCRHVLQIVQLKIYLHCISKLIYIHTWLKTFFI